MGHLGWLVAGGALIYASTNLDDLLLLIAFLAHPEFAGREVAVGQLGGMAALLLVALLGSGAASVLSPAHVGLLGLAPLALGSWRLVHLRAPSPEDAWAEPDPRTARRRALVVARPPSATAATTSRHISPTSPLRLRPTPP